MVNFIRAGIGRPGWALLLSAASGLLSGAARAVPVTDYITVQPIDVCAGTTPAGILVGCSPINNLPQPQAPNRLGQNAATNPGTIQIGFIDPKSNINISNAIFNQIGIDVTFLPVVPDVSPGNLTLKVDSCAPDGTDCQSAQFRTLSQQVLSANPPPTAISQGAAPKPPLSPNPTTMNMLFVTTLNPPPNQPGNLYGLAWINDNGIAVSSNTLIGGAFARPDTLAHEIGHNLDLDHTNFGAGPSVPQNQMTAGGAMGKNLRIEPNPNNISCGAGCTQAAWVNQVYPTGAPNPPPLDQLTLGEPSSQTQQGQVALSPFLNPIPLVNTPATNTDGGNDFLVSFESGGRLGEHIDTLTLTTPANFLFPLGTRVNVFKNPDGLTVDPMFNCSDSSCAGNPICTSDSGCTSLVLDFTHGAPFIAGESIDYELCVNRGDNACVPISVDDLARGTYTYLFETDQLVGGIMVPVELFQTTSQLLGPGDLFSDSQDPFLSIPSEVLNPDTFVGFSTTPCTALPGVDGCPLVLADGSPLEEGGQPVPEPPSLPILLAGASFAFFFYRRTGSRRIGVCPVSAM